MGHSSLHMAASRFNDPKHTGAARTIRAELARTGKPMSVYQLALATGLKHEQVKRAISGMLGGSTGGLTVVKGSNGVTYYDLYKPAPKREPASVAKAGPITNRARLQLGGETVTDQPTALDARRRYETAVDNHESPEVLAKLFREFWDACQREIAEKEKAA